MSNLQMLKQLRRWLGWDSDSSPFDFGAREIPDRSRPAAPKVAVDAPATKLGAARVAPPAQPTSPRAKKPASLEMLDNPKLTLDRVHEDGFDPYNTDAFDRSASWERISRHKR